ncbi:hypothetical protein [Shewanella fidelis]|uniref:Uncharacterized protein n=1 Tax=Shewanella fidelis TaxID=173509 RepID=A0AAW8NNG4_9GAMM|nr:hypothetical protein [Shewanella fidelis]MDR8523830.1 hypothetical protein [Shewanella fidelis]MDW4810378.1 hypothetical protein [Shewanella fidelis]MDW4814523.1 hypothetical protein [Shewanella fidelis]MDW4818613.1 hypothetical protein [Shewanella fidelis]MDW4823734.1 hypothetical protein [Shewanella fidelis]
MKLFILFLALFSIASSAEKTQNFTVKNAGASCFKEPSWPNESTSKYLCVFELNAVSPYFEENTRMEVLNSFVKSQSLKCKISDGIEMTDPKANTEHAMFLIVYHVSCS